MYFTHHDPDQDNKSIPLIVNDPVDHLHTSGDSRVSSVSNSISASQNTGVIHHTTSNNNGIMQTSKDPSSFSTKSAKIMNAVSQKGFTSEEFTDFDSSQRAIGIAVVAILVYLLMGTLVFGLWVDGWTLVDALYYTVATFTTVGYGDLYPESLGQRMFGIFFITGGIMIIGGVVFGILFDTVFGMLKKSIADNKNCAANKFIQKFDDQGGQAPSSNSAAEDDTQKFRNILINISLVCAIVSPALIIGHYEGWTFGEAIYFAIVTATTVGYGDLSPQLLGTRLAAVFYLPLCVGIMARVFGQITNIYMDRKAKEEEDKFLSRSLTSEDIENMDFGGDGTVNKEEFLVFMLVSMGKVDQESIDQIRNLFDALDKDDDNCLDITDVVIKAYGDENARTQRGVNEGGFFDA